MDGCQLLAGTAGKLLAGKCLLPAQTSGECQEMDLRYDNQHTVTVMQTGKAPADSHAADS